MDEKVVVLLGAGASIEAGLPGSRQLTQQVADRYSNSRFGRDAQTLRTLNAVAGAMIAFDAARGGSAFEALDIERLFSAVEMLAERDVVELAPFVASWQPGIEEATTPGLPSFFGKNLRAAVLDTHFGDQKTEQVFREGVKALSDKSSSNAFANLRDNLVLVLREVLLVDPARVTYLIPLVRQAASQNFLVATLNYDLALETAASSTGLHVDTGIGSWPGGLEWAWEQTLKPSLQLLKLHGSVNWVYEKFPTPRVRGVRREASMEILDLSDEHSIYSRRPPGLVFGQRGKLRSDGPFLAMLLEFARKLERAERLVIIGYSLRDAHINSVIRTWLTGKPGRRVTIVDPGFPRPEVMNSWEREKYPQFMVDLLQEIYEEPDRTVRDYKYILKPGQRVERQGASAALKTLFA